MALNCGADDILRLHYYEVRSGEGVDRYVSKNPV